MGADNGRDSRLFGRAGHSGLLDMHHMCNLETVKTYEGTDHIHTLVIGEKITGIPAYR